MGGTASAASAFLPFSNPEFSNLGTQTYAAGSLLGFTSIAGDLGLCEAALITVNLNVTPTIASGNSIAWSPMRSFFNRVQVEQGGETYKDVHPWFFILRNALNRRMYLPNYNNTNVGGDYSPSQYATGYLGNTLPGLVTGTAASAVFQFLIPFRWLRGRLEGMFPIGDSSNPLTIRLSIPTPIYGSDPENNLFLVHSPSTDSVAINSGTVNVVLIFRSALAYAPNTTISTPVVGSQLKVVQSSVGFTQIGSEISVGHSNRYPHTMIVTVVEDGNANTDTHNTLGMMNAINISRFRFILTTKTPVIDLDEAPKIAAFFSGQREELGFDLPDGVFPFFPLFQQHGIGYFNDPNLEEVHQIPDFNIWRNALTGVTVASGTAINVAAPGLARVRTFSEFLIAVDY